METFTYTLPATDGGAAFSLFCDDKTAIISRGETDLAQADDLEIAWDDYLYTVESAPVDAAQLEAMWAAYDAHCGGIAAA